MLRRLRWLRTTVRADVLEGRWKPANAPEWPLSRYFQPQITGGDRHKLHTMLQPSSKVSRGPTQGPTPLRPFAASFEPIHFAQPRDTPKTHSQHPGTLPSLALRPYSLRPLRPLRPLPTPSTTAAQSGQSVLYHQYHLHHHHQHHPSSLCCSCSTPHDDHHASCVWICVCVGVKEVYDGPAARLACPLPPSDAPADALTPGLASPMTTKAAKDKGNLRSAHLPFASTQYRAP